MKKQFIIFALPSFFVLAACNKPAVQQCPTMTLTPEVKAYIDSKLPNPVSFPECSKAMNEINSLKERLANLDKKPPIAVNPERRKKRYTETLRRMLLSCAQAGAKKSQASKRLRQ